MTTNPLTGHEAAPELVPEAVIDDLRSRIRSYRRVPLPAGLGWERGTDGDYLESLLAYWLDSYDWRENESRIRGLPWALMQTDSGAVRAIHQRCTDPDAIPVLLLHGWPDFVLRFEKLLPLLRDVHVVSPHCRASRSRRRFCRAACQPWPSLMPLWAPCGGSGTRSL